MDWSEAINLLALVVVIVVVGTGMLSALGTVARNKGRNRCVSAYSFFSVLAALALSSAALAQSAKGLRVVD